MKGSQHTSPPSPRGVGFTAADHPLPARMPDPAVREGRSISVRVGLSEMQKVPPRAEPTGSERPIERHGAHICQRRDLVDDHPPPTSIIRRADKVTREVLIQLLRPLPKVF